VKENWLPWLSWVASLHPPSSYNPPVLPALPPPLLEMDCKKHSQCDPYFHHRLTGVMYRLLFVCLPDCKQNNWKSKASVRNLGNSQTVNSEKLTKFRWTASYDWQVVAEVCSLLSSIQFKELYSVKIFIINDKIQSIYQPLIIKNVRKLSSENGKCIRSTQRTRSDRCSVFVLYITPACSFCYMNK